MTDIDTTKIKIGDTEHFLCGGKLLPLEKSEPPCAPLFTVIDVVNALGMCLIAVWLLWFVLNVI